MINPDLQPGKPVQTRSGLEAVVYEVHEGQKYPIIGAYKDEDGNWVPFAWRADGSVWEYGPDPHDIIPKPKKLTGFINVYEGGPVAFRREWQTADWSSSHNDRNRIACIDLASLNLTEGHGLTEGSSDG